MSSICIIPARGGSKRIPKKNIKYFLGKPIICYSIEAALKSKLFEIVMVSTDDKEIAEVAIKYGAEVPFYRSSKNSDDFATTFDVIEEVLERYKQAGINFNNACCIYSCAPFVTPERIKNSYDFLVKNNFYSVFPIIQYSFPIQRAMKINKNQKVSFFQQKYSLTKSQDLEPSFHDAGQFYWLNVEKCLESKQLVTSNTGSIIINELEGQDIDNEIDWKLAELKYEILQSNK